MKTRLETIFSRFDHGLWGFYLPVPESIAIAFVNGKDRRVVVCINDSITLHSALMPDKGLWFIMLNKQVVKKLGLLVGDRVSLTIEKDRSEYGMPMPEEMFVCLEQDESASVYFSRLSPGKQRSLIYLISKIKNPDLRIRKTLAILHHLNANEGQLDYKILNETFKDFNESLL
jgi:hypothetical protein